MPQKALFGPVFSFQILATLYSANQYLDLFSQFQLPTLFSNLLRKDHEMVCFISERIFSTSFIKHFYWYRVHGSNGPQISGKRSFLLSLWNLWWTCSTVYPASSFKILTIWLKTLCIHLRFSDSSNFIEHFILALGLMTFSPPPNVTFIFSWCFYHLCRCSIQYSIFQSSSIFVLSQPSSPK